VTSNRLTVQYCATFGITLPQLLDTPEAAACAAYARYILDVGAQGDVLELYMAVAGCLIGYGEVGLWLRQRIDAGHAKFEGNPYRRWIEDYSAPDFLAAVDRGIGERLIYPHELEWGGGERLSGRGLTGTT